MNGQGQALELWRPRLLDAIVHPHENFDGHRRAAGLDVVNDDSSAE